jgi:hypothetical protein
VTGKQLKRSACKNKKAGLQVLPSLFFGSANPDYNFLLSGAIRFRRFQEEEDSLGLRPHNESKGWKKSGGCVTKL